MPDAGASGGAEGAGGGLGDGTAGMGDSGYGGGDVSGGGDYGGGAGSDYGGAGLGSGDFAGTGLGAMDAGAQAAGSPGVGASGAQGIGGFSNEGGAFTISSFAKSFRSLFSGLSVGVKTAANPLGALTPSKAIGVAPNAPPDMVDRAAALAGKQNTARSVGGIVGGFAGSALGPVGTAGGKVVGETLGGLVSGLTDPAAMGYTTGPLGYQDPQAVASFNDMMANSQPGGGGDEGVIADMAKRTGVPAISAKYPQPAIMSPQARAVYQNR